jgi:hypothetical protein
MRVPLRVGLVDVGIATILAVAVLLPPREMYASAAIKGSDAEQFAIGLAEARTIARPNDGQAVEDLARKLGEAGMKDWAVEAAHGASDRAKDSPSRWRALLATSVAYVDLLDVVPGLDYANRAIAACDAARDQGDQTACPSWEEIRMQLYQQNLDAGVKSGIDPKQGPKAIAAFRRASEAALREIRLVPDHRAPVGSGSAGSAGSGSRPTAP